jgi:hypothetical protein
MKHVSWIFVPMIWLLALPAAAEDQAVPVSPTASPAFRPDTKEDLEMLKDLEFFQNLEIFAEPKDETKTATKESKEDE